MLTEKLARTLVLVALLAAPAAGSANEGEGVKLLAAGNDIRSHASLQRGARNFMNYCAGCHSAQYVRYNRIATDLGIPEAELRQNLMFTSDKPADTIRSALAPADAIKWFGTSPPDLSLMSRARGTDYIYTFLKSFYPDPSRPNGVNNHVLPGTAMPNVYAGLQARLPAEKFDETVRDTVNFLQYIGEPIEARRRDLGVWVMLFLLVFTAFAYLLYREYWKDVR
jgi:ubiquinol-cytochrome c reductase cytochrome c1 subunit